MNTAVALETLRYMRVFCVVYFGVSYVLYDTCVIAFFCRTYRGHGKFFDSALVRRGDCFPIMGSWFYYLCCGGVLMERGLMQIIDLLRKTVSLLFHAWILLCRAGVGGSLVDRHLEELRQVGDGCMGRASQEEQLRLRLQGLGLPVTGRRSDDISLRELGEAMDINLQHPGGGRKGRDKLVEALVSAWLSDVLVLGNLHTSFVDAFLKDLRQVRDGASGQAAQRDALGKRLNRFPISSKRDHVATLTDLCLSLELPKALPADGGMLKAQSVDL